jgi:hypothetical protein
MADKIEIRTVGTLYLGGQQHGFPPGSVVPIPAEHATDLIKAGHAEDPTPPAPTAEAEVAERAAEPEVIEAAAQPAA